MMGPSAVVVSDKGDIYVAHYDVEESQSEPAVSWLNSTGEMMGTIRLPEGCGPEITGLAFNAAQDTLFITEASSSSLYEFHVLA
mmetsp:Transcript_18297/g.55906  ORF Transcript_18297/g.55906 Transcript_18297/m.55906 type:complete len:84 (-) Transcript_18297:988-1239(-)